MESEYLAREGYLDSRSQIVTLKNDNRGSNIKYYPYVFTEQVVAMLSSVLKSKKAIDINITIMRTFVKMRNFIYSYKDLAEKVEKLEKSYDKKIGKIFEILNRLKQEEPGNKSKAVVS